MREICGICKQAGILNKNQITRELKALVPTIKSEYIEISKKVGIRAQLYNINEKRLEDDFICLKGESSLHVLNAISPAFTASFALADEIIDRTEM